MRGLTQSEIRFRVDPADVPPNKAARRLHLTVEKFNEIVPRLRARGFPAPDPDTGNFDLEAIEARRQSRNPHLFGLTQVPASEQVTPTPPEGSLGDRFAAKKRNGNG